MAYNHDYIEDLALFASTVAPMLQDVEDALNAIDVSDLPREALDTQHFAANYALRYAGTTEDAAIGLAVDETIHAVSTWPPVYTEYRAGTFLNMAIWDPKGEYKALEVWGNANLAQVTSVAASPQTLFVQGIAVWTLSGWEVVPRTVRVFSIPDHQTHSGGVFYMDMPVHTVLFDGDVSGAVFGVRLVWGIRNGSGTTVCYVGGSNITALQKRTGDLGV